MIRANFSTYNSYVTDVLYQWDINQDLTISGLNLTVAPEIHFTNDIMDRAIVRQSSLSNGVVTVRIPNSLLQEHFNIKAYVGVYNGTTFNVIETIEIQVIAKNRPSDYSLTDTDEEIYSFVRLENKIANMVSLSNFNSTKSELLVQIKNGDDAISAQIANIVAHNNDTDGNTELIDMRVDHEGNTHTSAGEAVRSQIDKISNDISEMENDIKKVYSHILDRNNLIKDVTFSKVAESWGENEGWYYNWDDQMVKEIKQSEDFLYKELPTLYIKLDNASGKSKFVATRDANFIGKTIFYEFAFYIASGYAERAQLHIGSNAVYTKLEGFNDGWNYYSGVVSIPNTETNDTVRITFGGNIEVYVAPILLKESVSTGLTINETVHNLHKADKENSDKIGDLIDNSGYHYESATNYLKELSDVIGLSRSTNIFNKLTITEKKALSFSDGTPVDSDLYFISDFINVIPNRKLYFSKNNLSLSSNPINRLCYYDKTKRFLGFIDKISEFEIPNDCYYIRFHYYYGYQNGLQVEYDKITPFVEHGLIESVIADKATKAYDITSALSKKEFIIPPKLYCVTEHEMNLFFDNCIYNDSIKNVPRIKADILSDCSMVDRWYWKPSESDTSFTNAFRAYFNNTSDLSISNFCSCRVVPKNAGNGKNIKCLFIGDSITQSGGYLSELVNLFENDVMNISLLGTKQSTYQDSSNKYRTVLHEGRGGWSAKTYCTNSEMNGVPNAFWNNKFDFNYYMNSNKYSNVDYVFLMLGTNDLAHPLNDIIEHFTTMINEIKSYSQDIQIFVSLCPPLSSRQDTFDLKNKRLSLVKIIIESFGNLDNVHLVPLYVNVDPLWDFPYVTNKFLSSRHNDEYIYVTDNTHPLPSGHYKMADVLYSIIKYVANL